MSQLNQGLTTFRITRRAKVFPKKSDTKTIEGRKSRGAHVDTLDQEKHVFEYDCFARVLGNFHNKFELCLEASDSDSLYLN